MCLGFLTSWKLMKNPSSLFDGVEKDADETFALWLFILFLLSLYSRFYNWKFNCFYIFCLAFWIPWSLCSIIFLTSFLLIWVAFLIYYCAFYFFTFIKLLGFSPPFKIASTVGFCKRFWIFFWYILCLSSSFS